MIKLTDFVNICRLCLKHLGDDSINLFSRQKASEHTSEFSVAEIIESLCNIKVEKGDGLPECVCIGCWNTVSSMQNLQMVSLKSDRHLNEIIVNSLTSMTETNDLHQSDEILDIKIEFVDTQSNEELSQSAAATKSKTRRKTKTEQSNEDSLEAVTKSRTRRKVRKKQSSEESSQAKAAATKPKNRRELKTEPRTQHNGNEISEKKSSDTKYEKKKISCEICGKLVVKYILQYHLNVHKGIRPYKCKADDCEKCFYSPNEARTHYRKGHIYKITRPYKCDVCGAGFMQSSNLATHRTYHFDPEIPCTICGQLYQNKKALQKHSLVHSGERKFRCSECDKSYQTLFTLKTHMRIHNNEKPFSCSHCTKAFAYKCLLKAHIEKHHPNESG